MESKKERKKKKKNNHNFYLEKKENYKMASRARIPPAITRPRWTLFNYVLGFKVI